MPVTKTVRECYEVRDGKRGGERGNPLTGPFYVEGAEPGDALVVSELAHLPAPLQPDDEPDGQGHQGAVDGLGLYPHGFLLPLPFQ